MLAVWQKPFDFSGRKEYGERASGRTPGKIAGHAKDKRGGDQLVFGERATNQ